MTTLSSIRRTIDLATGVGITTYATAAELPTTGLTAGDQAFVTSTGRLYISNSNGWYNIALINQAPYWIEQPDGSYSLSTTGLSTVITILAGDSDSTAPSYTATADSDFNQIATITTDSEGADGTRFIITPLDSEGGTAIAGSGTVTFIATDGINQASVVSTFSLTFGPDWSATPTESKLVASDIQAGDQFGWSVSMSSDGSYAIVGAHVEDTGGSGAGAAYIFTRSGSTWTQQAKIQASDAQTNDQFGESVSINSDGTYVIVGAYGEDTGATDAGAAYIFVRSGSTWTQQAKITASDAQEADLFGQSVSISSDGSYAIVSASYEDAGGSAAGAAYIFVRSGSTWTQQQKIQASDAEASDYFGQSVSMSSDGTSVIVGAYGESSAGAAYVFTRSGSTWTQQAKITASDAQVNDYFGYSVSINSDATYAIVGAYGEDGGAGDPLGNAGAAYIFTRSGSTWTQQAKITASDAQAVDSFGWSVSMSSDGTSVIVGAYHEDAGASDAGAVYVFSRSGSTWTQQAKIIASDIQADDRFGWSVSMSSNGTYVIVGAYLEDGGAGNPASNAGAAYIYEAG